MFVVYAYAWSWTALAGQLRADEYAQTIKPLVEAKCATCHDKDSASGGIDFTPWQTHAEATRGYRSWRKITAQLEAGTMPPPDGEPISTTEREQLLGYAKRLLHELDSTPVQKRSVGPVAVRRLNLTEYNNSVADLLGFEFDGVSVGMTDESGEAGYGKLAAALILSPVLMEKYFAASDRIIDRLYGIELDSSVDGGITERAKKAREAMFGPWKKAPTEPREKARAIITPLARRAYRRPVTEAEIEQLLSLFDRVTASQESFEAGLRPMLQSLLVSPYFLLHVEQDRAPAGSADVYAVTDHELASRLSYFLWSSPPDVALDAVADAGKLHEPEMLAAEVKRMLDDPKAQRLSSGFAAPWLQVNKLAAARPSQEFFPTFSATVRGAMLDETMQFFDTLRKEDRSVLELLSADYTFLNEELATHYKIAGVTGKEMRRVTLRPEDHRGGLLGMGSMLASTSATSRTSPTLRGKWILDVMFGAPPPAPPANVSMLKETDADPKAPKTFREKMAQHAADATCAACHKRMDPLGYALENFDAVGVWRTEQGGLPVDASGILPGGKRFAGADALKQLVWERRQEFVRTLTEQLFVYALGRELDYYDQPAIADAMQAIEADGHRFSSVILAVARSFPMTHRQNTDALSPAASASTP